MGKLFRIFIGITLVFFLGCTNTFEKVTDFTTEITSNIIQPVPESVRYTILQNVNGESELYAIGVSNLGDGGVSFANARALKNARDKLRMEIKDEAELQIRSYIISQDNQTRKILSEVVADMSDYIVEHEISLAKEKGFWDDGRRAYVLLTISRKEVKTGTDRIYSAYIEELSRKIKATVRN